MDGCFIKTSKLETSIMGCTLMRFRCERIGIAPLELHPDRSTPTCIIDSDEPPWLTQAYRGCETCQIKEAVQRV
jgi:hypothetical protein